MSTPLTIIATTGAVLSGVNTLLIWRIITAKDGHIARLTSAILHTQGETQAAHVVSPPPAKKVPTDSRLPYEQPRQVGLSPRTR